MLLLLVAFIPFPTAVISEYTNRTATIFYALIMTLTGLMSGAIWWYAAQHDRLIDPNMDRQQRHYERLAPLVIPSIFLLSIDLAFINADLARYAWALTALAALLIR